MKNIEIIDEIKKIYFHHKGRYGNRRITSELNKKEIVNHKKVKRLMSKLGLYSIQRKRRKYSSYKGIIGKVADNLIQRDFFANEPNKKWYTDVTEFKIGDEKLYLSPILDGCARNIIAYDLSTSPNLDQVKNMLLKAFDRHNGLDGLIFHSDQGWQYQHKLYQNMLKEKKINQSMSRKGNSMDNGLMENFFGILKCEMFYDQESNYKTIEELKVAIEKYIHYYNYERISLKLKGLTPVEYRNQSMVI